MAQTSEVTGGLGQGGGTVDEEPGSAQMRADARRNRAQILAAAETVFADQGLAVPIDEVARRAGVGVGTVYRHFPTKERLFEAVVVHHIERLTREVRALSERDDPGAALFEFLGLVATEGASKRNLADALSGAGINIKEIASKPKAELEQAAGNLLERAQEAGQVRSDVSLADLLGLVMGACSAAGNDTVQCSQARMLSIVCEGLRPGSTAEAVAVRASEGVATGAPRSG